jgi:hypothetical protein
MAAPVSDRGVEQITPETLRQGDLSKEKWREYEFGTDGTRTTYRILSPVTVFYRSGGSTHRVLDSLGVVHCVPAPGILGCVLRWVNVDPTNPVNW